MTNLLLPATPLFGHVSPVVEIGAGLRSRGHRVTVLTGGAYRRFVQARGLGFRELPAAADVTAGPDGPTRRRARVLSGRDAVIDTFLRPLAAQHDALLAAAAEVGADLVLADTAYLGALPMLLSTPASRRLPIFGISATPLSVVSVDCAPFGSALQPGDSAFTRRRNRDIHWLLRRGPLQALQEALDDALRPYGIEPGRLDYFDHVLAFDRTFHLSGPGSEYPRRELPDTVSFVGPPVGPTGPTALPPWWGDLDSGRPVVHVTQGTMANTWLSTLLAPAVRGLADTGTLVVVSTGGRPVADLAAELGGALPRNVRVAPFLPYRQLLPRTSVMVTNGGYGGVQLALRHGVPLVVAGVTEDKPEVAARVRWSGAGLDLRTGRPRPRQVARAVTRVLEDPRFRSRTATLAEEIRDLGDPVSPIAAAIARAVDASASVGAERSHASELGRTSAR